MGNVRIIKETNLSEDEDVQIRILNDLSDNETDNACDEHLFFCSQNKQRKTFYPKDYAYIEATSIHYTNWHPKKPEEPVLSIYTMSLGKIYKRLCESGFSCFLRVHSSYIVNIHCIKEYHNNKLILKDQNKAIPISKEYRNDFLSKVTMI